MAKAKEARKQGADVVAIAMHSVQEYLDYADSWQQSEAHELADTGAFDVIYGAGCHCAQPVENYNGTCIIYGLGNAVTVTSYIPGNEVNNQGVTARVNSPARKAWPAHGGSIASIGCRRPMCVKANTSGVRFRTTIRMEPVGTKQKMPIRDNVSGTRSIPWARTRTWFANGTSPQNKLVHLESSFPWQNMPRIR